MLKTSNLVVISALHLPSYQSMLIDLCRMHGFLPNIVYNVNNASSLVYNLHEKMMCLSVTGTIKIQIVCIL